jgi:glycogen(starch) synthase
MTADTIGGVWTYSMELTRSLAARNMRIALATMGAPVSPVQRKEAEAIKNVELFESSFQLEWMPRAWKDVDRAGEWLLSLERETCAEIVHLNGYAHGALTWKAPALIVAHSCVLSWWEAVKQGPAPAEWNEYRRRVRQGLCAVDLIVAPTRAMLRALEKHYGPCHRTRVIANGRNPSEFFPVQKEPFIFAAGRLGDEAKNIAVLGRAAESLPWNVIVAGQASDASGNRSLPQNVCHLGFLSQEELAKWLSRAAIYCLPARYEPFGLSILEAAFAGCALVLGDIDSLREIWGETALFVPPSDPMALHITLRQLIEDPALREALSAKARRRALRYSAENFGAEYYDVYRAMLKCRGLSRKNARS